MRLPPVVKFLLIILEHRRQKVRSEFMTVINDKFRFIRNIWAEVNVKVDFQSVKMFLL